MPGTTTRSIAQELSAGQDAFELDITRGLLQARVIEQALEDCGHQWRSRVYTPVRVVLLMIWQALNGGSSCRAAVARLQAGLKDCNRTVSGNTSAYVQAQARLPQGLLPAITKRTAQLIRKAHGACWRGLRVTFVDGTGISMEDTPANRKTFDYAGGQKQGCGFPVAKMVGAFCMRTGVLLDAVIKNWKTGEIPMLHDLIGIFRRGDLVVADRGFCSYPIIHLLAAQSARILFRVHHARTVDMRRGKRLGRRDRLVRWPRPTSRPRWMVPELFRSLPEQLELRLIATTFTRRGQRAQRIVVVTNLLDPVTYPAEEILGLYAARWEVELDFRHVKTCMEMDHIRAKSTDMFAKMVWAKLLTYNLVRGTMAEAADLVPDLQPSRISFKGTVDRRYCFQVRRGSPLGNKARQRKSALQLLAADVIPARPGRYEPRARKRRPKPFPLMTAPRDKLRRRHRAA